LTFSTPPRGWVKKLPKGRAGDGLRNYLREGPGMG